MHGLQPSAMEMAEVRQRSWDVIVVGTGIGGATAGYELARNGLRVLFVEKGLVSTEHPSALKGGYPESHPGWAQGDDHRRNRLLALSGRRWEALVDGTDSAPKSFLPFLGAGIGGSSLLYGAAMERMFPEDFGARNHHLDDSIATLAARWPIAYEELEPYYVAAEKLYAVRGTRDPLKPAAEYGYLQPAPLSPPAEELRDFFCQKGLHPYRLPTAIRDLEDCPGCQGFLCPRGCKNDSATVCVKPAVRDYGAGYLDQCTVHSLVVGKNKIEAVQCWRAGHWFRLQAKLFILAAGAIETPLVLLRTMSAPGHSASLDRSGLVGRNLMRHQVDLYAIFTHAKEGLPSNRKEIAFNDFYLTRSGKYGTVQSFGALPPGPVILHELQSGWPEAMQPYLRRIAPRLGRLIDKLFSNTFILAAIKEDLPYRENRVHLPDPVPGRREDAQIAYRLSEREKKAIKTFRKMVAGALRPYRFIPLLAAENNMRLAHACGTCRFGDDPHTSVLDRNNKLHGIPNLYVVDASFFPSSSGTNPSLTIAANALRVAAHLATQG